ncbi:MAG: aldo/keto reductase [Desmonostoc vinosum HA7617-LM4]|jgi:aryl-alcohol dehydrogenase-like predicted oxidoreductase|nr:aldo/keto reductase [Desmonostoc vinosum HA7617-LM4]
MKLIDLAPPPEVIASEVGCVEDRFPESDLPFYRKLGRTDLTVSCLGLGGGGGISSEDTLYAFDKGINYFFYSSDLHHYIYSSMSGALRQLCGRGSSVREKVVLATVTYIKNPEMAIAALFDQFEELGIDYIDVFFWGWIGANDGSILHDCLQLSPDLRGANSVYQRTIENMFGVSERLKKMGAVRYIGASFHDLNLAQQWLHSPLLDVVMVRHNAAHRSAQSQIFNQVDAQDPSRPGIVTFKTAGSHTNLLWQAPAGLPQTCWLPTVPDLYRYSLTQNSVDICLTGVTQRAEIDAAIAAVQQGKLTPAELEYLSLYGDLHACKLKIQEIPPEKLLHHSRVQTRQSPTGKSHNQT